MWSRSASVQWEIGKGLVRTKHTSSIRQEILEFNPTIPHENFIFEETPDVRS